MNRAVKWSVVITAVSVVLVVAALIIIPKFYNLNSFKPQIEKQVTAFTGRPFTLGGEINLSLFPWSGIALEDIQLGNPSGFSEKDFISVKSFEIRVKLIPLLSKNLDVQRFVVENPRIVLVKNKKGQANWEELTKPTARKPSQPTETKEAKAPSDGGFPIQSLAVGEFEIKNGSLLYLDEKSGSRNELSDLNMILKDVSFDRPILIDFSAKMDGQSIAIKGQMGPVGNEIGKNPIALDMDVAAFEEINLKLKGVLENLIQQPRFDLAFNLEPFSPRKMMTVLGKDFPVQTTDPDALTRLSLAAGIKGTAQAVSISDGVMSLDDSTINFSLQAKEFNKPDIAFKLKLDRIDADRYLPPQTEGAAAKEGKKPAQKKTDYTPLRKPVLNGTLNIGELKVKGAKVQDIFAQLAARNGNYTVDPMSLKLYNGSAAGKAVLDVRGKEPKTSVNLKAKQIQAGPLLIDFMEKDILEGALTADVVLSMAGDDPDRIKPTLNGKGALSFSDGAIKGIDLAGMARNVQSAFGLAEKSGSKPSTDFSELNLPFTITNGLFNTPNTNLVTPFLRLTAAGTADLVQEKLDFRVEPKVVGTLKGQGDTKERTGLMVPILVAGSFSKPSFKPDLEDMAKKKLQEVISDPSKLKEDPKKIIKSLEEQGKGLLKGFKLGN